MDNVAVVAPEMVPPLVTALPPFFQAYVNVPVPAAATDKLIAVPAHCVREAEGCVEIVVIGFTVNPTALEVALPHVPPTVTE